MSVYLIRTIEIKTNNSKGYIYNLSDLERVKPNPGDIYKFVQERIHKAWDGKMWIPKNPDYKWERLKWGGVEEDKDIFYSNGGPLRDYVFSKLSSPYEDLVDRGIPEDTDPGLKEFLEDKDNYGHTWVLLSELERILETEIEKFKGKVQKTIEKSWINKRFDRLEEILLKKEIKEQNLEDPEDTIEFLFSGDGDIWILLTIEREISRISLLAEQFGGTWKAEDIRIHYHLE